MAQKNRGKGRPSGTSFFKKVSAFFVNTAKKTTSFFSNLKAELKRVVWPDRKKLIQSTTTVLVICLIVGLGLFLIDTVLSSILNGIGFYAPAATTLPQEQTQQTTAELEPVETEQGS